MKKLSKPRLDKDNAEKIENLINSVDKEVQKLGWDLLYNNFNICSWILREEEKSFNRPSTAFEKACRIATLTPDGKFVTYFKKVIYHLQLL